MSIRHLAQSILFTCLIINSVLAVNPAVTVYNQNFGVVRETVRLDLQPGVNEVRSTEITAHLESDSVMLRDPSGNRALRILEQNYRADPLSQPLLLSLFEGQTIDFAVAALPEPIRGRIVRSGYVPHQSAWQQYGYDYRQRQAAYAHTASGQPIIEVDGQLRFGLPGVPLFPNLADDTVLQPTLHWLLETDAAGAFEAELCYVTGGMSWKADYNVVAPPEGDVLDLVGWVTIDNQTGRTFEDARIKLMAGEVSKLRPEYERFNSRGGWLYYAGSGGLGAPPVTEEAFDEYHLYTLNRSSTLRDRETKQVEFLRASGIQSRRLYVYDGVRLDQERYHGWSFESIRQNRDYGTESKKQVWVMREFANESANNLGQPLPAGRVRFYRRADDGQLEFTGENRIGHTPRDETVRVYTGSAFDLVGQRRRMDFQINTSEHWVDESFEIRLRNHKDEPVEIRVVEHLYRCRNWTLTAQSHEHQKTESQTIEFRVQLAPDAEEVVTYSVHYTW
ncbi:MAG: DUF4139 domain-containing protein [bacterium]|nr:DUF4139 domain-containing protein [bacterium]